MSRHRSAAQAHATWPEITTSGRARIPSMWVSVDRPYGPGRRSRPGARIPGHAGTQRLARRPRRQATTRRTEPGQSRAAPARNRRRPGTGARPVAASLGRGHRLDTQRPGTRWCPRTTAASPTDASCSRRDRRTTHSRSPTVIIDRSLRSPNLSPNQMALFFRRLLLLPPRPSTWPRRGGSPNESCSASLWPSPAGSRDASWPGSSLPWSSWRSSKRSSTGNPRWPRC